MNPQFAESVVAELAYMQQLLDEYAAGHRKIANRLRHRADGTSAAAAARLTQAFAFLLARTQRRIDDQYPQILRPLVDLIGMPGLATVPAMTTVEFVVSADQAPDASGGVVPRGTRLESDPLDGVPARFRTCSDVFVWPIELTSASLVFPPFRRGGSAASEATCAVRLSLRTMASNLTFRELGLNHLRFFIRNDLDEALWLYHVLFADTMEIMVQSAESRPGRLAPESLQPSGFSPRDSLFPGVSHDGARPLVEFLCFPDKFLYFELHELGSVLQDRASTEIDVDFYLRCDKEAIPRRFPPTAIRLNCTPAVNLFERRAAPIEVRVRSDRVALSADLESPEAYEIHSVNRVFVRDSKESESEVPRFHALRRFADGGAGDLRWEYDTLEQSAVADRGRSVGLRFVDEEFAPRKLESGVVSAALTCSNGDHPRRLPFGEDGCRLRIEALPFVSECRCLTPPTRLRRLKLAQTMWERVEQRAPDPLTLASPQGAAALRTEIQRLACDDDEILQRVIASLVDVRLERSTGISAGRLMCHGVDAVLVFQRSPRLPRGHLLFVRVLQELLAQSATEGVIFRLRSEYDDGQEILECPVRSGARYVI
jgi:type VI secretion system protein ImpG